MGAGRQVGFGLGELGLEVPGLEAVRGARFRPDPGGRVEGPRHVAFVVLDAVPIELEELVGRELDLPAVGRRHQDQFTCGHAVAVPPSSNGRNKMR